MLCVSRSRFAYYAARRVFTTTNARVGRASLLHFSDIRCVSLHHPFGSAPFSTVTAVDDSVNSTDDPMVSSDSRGLSDQRGIPLELRRELSDKVVNDFNEVMERVATEHRNGYAVPDHFIRNMFARITAAARAYTNEELKQRGVKTLEPAIALKNIEDIVARSKDWQVTDEVNAPSLINILLLNNETERAAAIFADAKKSSDVYRNDICFPFIVEFARNGDIEGFRSWLDKQYPATPEEIEASEKLQRGGNAESARDNVEDKGFKQPLRPRFLATRQFLWSLAHSGDMEKCDELLNSLKSDSSWTVRLSPRSALLHWIVRGNSKGIENGQKLAERHNMSKDVGAGQLNRIVRSHLSATGHRNGRVAEALRTAKACQSQGMHVPLTEFVAFSRRAIQDNAVPRFHFLLYRLEEHGMAKAAWRNMFNDLLRSVDENTVAHVPMLWRALQRRGGPNSATRAILTSKESRYRFLNNPDVPSSMLSFLGVPGNQDWTQQAAAAPTNPNQWTQQPIAQQASPWQSPPQQQAWGAPAQYHPAADPWGTQQIPHEAQQPQWGPYQPMQPQWGVQGATPQPSQAGGSLPGNTQQPNNHQQW